MSASSDTFLFPVFPVVKSSSLYIYARNAIAKHSNPLSIRLQANQTSNKLLPAVSPNKVDFSGPVIGTIGAATGLDSASIITNAGKQMLTITGYGLPDDLHPPVPYTNVTKNGTDSVLGNGFTSGEPPRGRNYQITSTRFYRDLDGRRNGGTQDLLCHSKSDHTAPIVELAVEDLGKGN
ncbi:MAG: hypothetical protein M1830_000985 [Pleopsidium flavum]|nr:MAG: hypothetical protein M1830_000985 [Pleopsidium flavum]